ncbi:lysoplasmalogenase [Actinomycetes bacterium M1A6_2h]
MIEVAYWGAAAVTVVGAATGRDHLQRATKPLLMPLLATRSRNPLLTAGLVAATVGDIAMLEPDDDRRIAAGASSFAVMQICWSRLLVRRGARLYPSAVGPRLAGWAVSSAVTFDRDRTVAPVLSAYGSTLAAMSSLSADPSMSRRIRVGGLLFTVSDATILIRRLALTNDAHRRLAEAFVLTTYAAAQYLLVSDFARDRAVASSRRGRPRSR